MRDPIVRGMIASSASRSWRGNSRFCAFFAGSCGVNIGTRESTKGFCLCYRGRIGVQRCTLAVAGTGRRLFYSRARGFRSAHMYTGLGQSRGCVATIRTLLLDASAVSPANWKSVESRQTSPSLFELIAEEDERRRYVVRYSLPAFPASFRALRSRSLRVHVYKMSQKTRIFLEQRCLRRERRRLDGTANDRKRKSVANVMLYFRADFNLRAPIIR